MRRFRGTTSHDSLHVTAVGSPSRLRAQGRPLLGPCRALSLPWPLPALCQPPAEPEVRRGQASGEVGLLGPSAAGVSA